MEPITLVLLLIYGLILLISVLGLTSLSIAAMVGALLTAWFGIQYGLFTYEEALAFIDFRLLGLLIGTMIVVEVARRGGLFNVFALHAIKFSGGDPRKLFVALCLAAAVVSMFLSDPTAMLLVAAATVTIARILNYNPTPYFLSAAIMINLGGTSTLIGSVSNMIIGVGSGLSFTDFISFLGLAEVILWALTILALYFLFKPQLGKKKVLPEFKPSEAIKDKTIFNRSILILVVMVIGFLLAPIIGIGVEGVALGCGILALLICKVDSAAIFRELDWETIFFIAGFMIIVAGIAATGLLETIATALFQATGGNSLATSLVTLWGSGAASAVLSNIAVALTFTPIIAALPSALLNIDAVWSGLILGTNLGGATTPFSGAVMMMAIGTLKREKIQVSFGDLTKVGIITSLIQLGFSTIYIPLRFGLI